MLEVATPKPLKIGGHAIAPGSQQRIELPVAELATQTSLSLPVMVVHGSQPGPKLWISAAIHGDEVNGVEIIRQVWQELTPQTLKGSIIAVPIVNIFGFIEQSRYLPDRRDLNRSFPGSPRGSLASRLAHLFMTQIVAHCHYGLDLHTASHHRTNFPQLRANLKDPDTYRCARAFGAPIMIHAATRDGSLRQAAAQRQIPVLVYEAGEALRFDAQAIEIGVQGIRRVLGGLGMTDPSEQLAPSEPMESHHTQWIRASRSGLLHLTVALGESVTRQQQLGWITDTFGDRKTVVRSPRDGMVIALTLNPLVNQGDGLVHLAILGAV